MQLLVLILKKIELIDELLKNLVKIGVKGGTILNGTGMANSLANIQDLPMFGILRRILSEEDQEESKVLLFVLKEEQMETVKETIREVLGDLSAPNTGIVFSVPINYVEGIGY